MKDYIEETEEIEVPIENFAKKLGLDVLYDGDRDVLTFNTVNVNRPGLILAGYDEYFGENRVQVIGSAEEHFLANLSKEDEEKAVDRLLSHNVPCVIICRGLELSDTFMKSAKKHGRAVFSSRDITSNLTNDLVMYLNDTLAPVKNIHGVLMDVYGVGVLLRGESGIGKSETALELIKRGHRLVADDAVLVKNVKGHLTGTAPSMIKFLMEIRGIGIINVRDMFGVGSVADEYAIELVIELEQWKNDKHYERLGNVQETEDILNQPIPKITMPVRPGRNLAVIVEVAARNHRLKQIGLDSVKMLKDNLNIE